MKSEEYKSTEWRRSLAEVFPNVSGPLDTTYPGDSNTPWRGENDPLPAVFPREIPADAMTYVADVLHSGFTSDIVTQFENKFAKACGVEHAIAVSNCTAACHSAIAVCDLEPGDEVIVSAITDYGSVMGILAEGLVPVFADVDPQSGNTTAAEIQKVITPRTRAILLVYFYGLMIDVDPVIELANRSNLILIEDCCQTPLASYKGHKAGSFGNMGCFSLDAEKHLSTDGGGIITTNDKQLAERLRRFAISRGSVTHSGFGRKHVELGFNYRYSSLQAAVGMAQLDVLPGLNLKRREAAHALTTLLEGIDGLHVYRPPDGLDHVYWLYSIRIEPDCFTASLDDIAAALVKEGMRDCGTARYYLIPEALLFLQRDQNGLSLNARGQMREVALRYRYGALLCPNAKWHLDHVIRWAWTAKYSERDINDMAYIVRKVLNFFRR